MKIKIYFVEKTISFDSSYINSSSIAGSEKTLINITNELAKDENLIIKVFNSIDNEKTINKVQWTNINRINVSDVPDYLIAMSDANLLSLFNCKKKYLWSHSVQPIEKFIRKKQLMPFIKNKPVMLLEGSYHYETRSFLTSLFGKKIIPIMIDRIQDRRGRTIYNADKRKCIKCEQISYLSDQVPKIEDNFEQIISPETAYQMISMLEGVVQRGTGRKLKHLNLNLAGKTGTTNNNTDTWFIGFTSKLVVGIYVGFDEPASLGRYETGGKTAMPIFKKFILNSISKQDATPFKVPDGIVMMVVDPATGQKVDFNSKNSIYESFKEKNISEADIENNYNDLIFNNSKVGTKEIIRFY